jgi:putative iron-dependent peroxidase
MAPTHQPGILRPQPAQGRFITFSVDPSADRKAALARLAEQPFDGKTVVGMGVPMLDSAPEGLRPFPGDLSTFPATQEAIWLFLTHGDRSAMFDAGRRFAGVLGRGFWVFEEVESFSYKGNKDLSGFEDGTENPKGKAALEASLIRGRGAGLDGGSFVSVQRWVHDLASLEAMSDDVRNAVIGRKRKGNAEIETAPASAHVKRTAQEKFEPPAFVFRRSMPYGGVAEHGLYFVAFGESLDRFERQLRRMAGRDDGIVDALAAFTRAVTGGYYFCPPLRQGKLDLRALGLA